MAATGLLGFNPYGGGFQFDPSSKVTNLAIQLQQKEEAKAEALDKYFKDYEKSINPAGLSGGEAKIFLDKFNKVKEYGIKNREQILHPTKHGYDAQANLTAGYKELLGYINEAKQATAERKAYNDFINKAKASGKLTSDNVIEIGTNAAKPVGAGYVKPDISQIQIFDPHDDIDFIDKTWKGVPLKEDIILEQGKTPEGKKGYRDVLVESITPEIANTYSQRARGYFRNNLGTQNQYGLLFQDKNFINQLNPTYKKYFNKDISNPEDLSVAFGLSSKQTKYEPKTGFKLSDLDRMQYQSNLIAGRQQKGEYNPEYELEAIYQEGQPVVTHIEGKKISGRKITLPEEISSKYDRKIGRFKKEPDYFVISDDKSSVYPVFVSDKTASGSDITTGSKLSDKISVKTGLLPAMGKTLGGIGWTKKNLFTQPITPTQAPSVAEPKGQIKQTQKGNVR